MGQPKYYRMGRKFIKIHRKKKVRSGGVRPNLKRDAVAPGFDGRERAAGAEVEERLDLLAEVRARAAAK